MSFCGSNQHNAHCHSAEDAGYEVMFDSCHAPVLVRHSTNNDTSGDRTYRGKPWTNEHEAAARSYYDWYANHFGKEPWDQAHPFAHVESRDWVLNRIASGLPIGLA